MTVVARRWRWDEREFRRSHSTPVVSGRANRPAVYPKIIRYYTDNTVGRPTNAASPLRVLRVGTGLETDRHQIAHGFSRERHPGSGGWGGEVILIGKRDQSSEILHLERNRTYNVVIERRLLYGILTAIL